jgi:cytochrome c553
MRLYFIAFGLALVASAASAGSLTSEEMAAGKKLAAAKCFSCHKWHEPDAYSDEKWNEWMVKMKRKAKLNNENYEKLTRYFNALRSQSDQQAKVNP